MQRDLESTGDSSGLRDQFMTIVSGLSRGDLTFPAPFDLATSAALAKNIDVGRLAEQLFDVTAARDCGYEVTISALNHDDGDPMRREIINTTVASTGLLVVLLDGLLDELDARLEAGRPAE